MTEVTEVQEVMEVTEVTEVQEASELDDPTIAETTEGELAASQGGNSDKAYIAPRVVPKAALPTNEHADAKVVINLPRPAIRQDDEVTQAIDRQALERQRARDAAISAARRQEPTIRIPRHQIEAARIELDAADRARRARNAEIEAAAAARHTTPLPGALVADGKAALESNAELPSLTSASPASLPPNRFDDDPSIAPSRSGSSRLPLVALAVVGVGILGGAAYYVTNAPADMTTTADPRVGTQPPATQPQTTQAAATQAVGAQPPATATPVTADVAIAPTAAETVKLPSSTSDAVTLDDNGAGARRPPDVAIAPKTAPRPPTPPPVVRTTSPTPPTPATTPKPPTNKPYTPEGI